LKEPINLSDDKCEEWMKRLLKRSHLIGERGEVPVSAVILDNKGYCIGHGSNRRMKDNDPMGHAELIALRQASWIRNDWRFNECTLIVTLEPCPMCAGALIQARMGQVIYGASDFKRGALGGTIDLSMHKSSHHKMIIRKGILKEKASKEIEIWFKNKRKKRVI
tara:strand:- start:16688 stop:17179 length:492 start_codon:yes stop_codon:yes gene_type:complete